MATGETLNAFTASDADANASDATADTRNNHPVRDFDDTTDEDAVFNGFLPSNYNSGGITVTVIWMATGAITGAVVWLGSWERHDDEGTDLDSDSFASTQTATGTAPGTSGMVQYTDITFTSAQIDGLTASESYRLKITRDANAGGDTMVGDAELLRVVVKET